MSDGMYDGSSDGMKPPPRDAKVYSTGHDLPVGEIPAHHDPDCVCGRCYPQGAGLMFSKRYALKQLGTCLMNLFGGP